MTKLTFAPQEIEQEKIKQVDLLWEFDPKKGIDAHFHHLVSVFGRDIVIELDDIVLDTPRRAAIKATQIYNQYAEKIGRQDKTKAVMQIMADEIKENQVDPDSDALLPPDAVFKGFDRPKG